MNECMNMEATKFFVNLSVAGIHLTGLPIDSLFLID